jgi:hypothetical protein
MVKPSRTMQPEQVDERTLKAGRKSGSSFSDMNTFHNYMARKIAVQRQQFGLVLPPPPTTKVEQPSSRDVVTKQPVTQSHHDDDAAAATTILTPRGYRKSLLVKRDPVETASPTNSKKRGIRFGQGTKPPATDSPKRNNYSGISQARSILMRLGKRHGSAQEKQERIKKLKHNESRNRDVEFSMENKKNSVDDVVMDKASPGVVVTAASCDASPLEKNGLVGQNNCVDGLLTLTAPKFDSRISHLGESGPVSFTNDYGGPLTTRDNFPHPTTEIISSAPKMDASSIDVSSPSTRKQWRPDLFFYGIVIKVQGFTDPDEHTLRRLIQKHGGDYETYETTRVTHVIASTMSTAKQNIYKNQRRPTPVCTPAWIVDSVNAGFLLSHGKYLLNKEEKQQELQSLYQKKPTQKDDVSTSEPVEMLSTSLKNDYPAKKSSTLLSAPKPTCVNASTITESTSPSPPKKQQLRDKTDRIFLNGKIRTVGTDPAFVENYFKSSRLSFIGSYRQRIPNAASRKRESFDKNMPSLSANARRFIYHVDMDQFFAAVVLRKYPQYRNRPVAISHLGIDQGQQIPNRNNISFKNSTSECATVNYEARKYGIKKGMFLSAAYERK